jgi:hypothetical protein
MAALSAMMLLFEALSLHIPGSAYATCAAAVSITHPPLWTGDSAQPDPYMCCTQQLTPGLVFQLMAALSAMMPLSEALSQK